MEVKTAELKARLSQYLRRVREDGSTYVIFDRKKPVALLSPLTHDFSNQAEEEKLVQMKTALANKGISLTLPATPPDRDWLPESTTAPDGRTDIRTVETMRQERDY